MVGGTIFRTSRVVGFEKFQEKHNTSYYYVSSKQYSNSNTWCAQKLLNLNIHEMVQNFITYSNTIYFDGVWLDKSVYIITQWKKM